MNRASQLDADIPAWQQAIRDRCIHPSGHFTSFARSEVEQSVPERFQKQVLEHGERVAIKTDEEQLTYEELNRIANRIAHAALAHAGARLALHLFEQGVAATAALLGILKSGCTYAPLDPLAPAARLSLIAGESEAELIVTNNRNLTLAREVAGNRQIVNVDELDRRVPDENPETEISPNDLAWVVYTSGSTARPKGVMQTHQNVLHCMMNYTDYFHVCPEDRLSNLFSFATHAGLFGLLMPLVNGAVLLPLDLRQNGPEYLARWLARHEVTVSCMVPTVFRRFASELSGDQQLPKLRLIYLAGEPVLRTDFELYRQHMPPGCIFVNRFGSTEMDCVRLFFADRETRITSGSVPIGYGVRDKELMLLGASGQPVDLGQPGEIAIRSRFISTGYWQKPELTEAAFTEDGEWRVYRTGDLGRMSADGCVEHLGRKDFQVKIRGYRVELAEVEAALLELAGVKDAVVMARENVDGNRQLVAYVVPKAEPGPSIRDLRNALTAKLPDYMVPAVFMTLAELPHAPNGKVDRRSLPAPGKERPQLASPFVAPRGAVEREVARVWAMALGIDQVGVKDAFLELGGDSIMAMKILSRVREAFAVELSPPELFACPTVALMAETIERRRVQDEVSGADTPGL
jgi:amino acid adenylation domain-containing protein